MKQCFLYKLYKAEIDINVKSTEQKKKILTPAGSNSD